MAHSANFAFTEFSEVRMQERAHNAPDWRYIWPSAATERPGQVAHDLTQLASDLAQTKADATNWLKGAEYATLRSRPR